MTTPDIDFMAFFAATPSPYLVLDTDLVIRSVNDAYLKVTGRTREELVGRYLFDALPPNPAEPEIDGVPNVRTSLLRALASGNPDTLLLQRYDLPAAEEPGGFEERWWSGIHTPIRGSDGKVEWIVERVEDVTAFVRSRRAAETGSESVGLEDGQEAELYARARELQRLNEELRQSHARERQVAVTLQEALLRSPDLARHRDIAVRYVPALGSLNVCGDWYDVVDLPPDRFAVAIGDVVGHGLEAAAVMGMLRSALSAAIRAVPSPAQALEVVGLYARSIEGAQTTTVAKVLIDPRSRLIIYSNAGHPPPVLLHRDGSCELLDQATDPPLGARPEHLPRPQAGLPYGPGDTLVLYTDGLIERRNEDIDAGLERLIRTVSRYRTCDVESICDSLLVDLEVGSGAADDIALVVVRL